jgi:hypothetical protein
MAMQFVDPNLVFIVNMASSNARVNTEYEAEPNPEFPHLISGGHLKYGSNHFLTFQKFTISSDGKMVRMWESGIKADDENSYVDVMGMTAHGNGLVICGSTHGAVTLLTGQPASKYMHGYNVPFFWDMTTLGTERGGGCAHSGVSKTSASDAAVHRR